LLFGVNRAAGRGASKNQQPICKRLTPPASNPAPSANSSFHRIREGSCADLGMQPIRDLLTCEAAAAVLNLVDQTANLAPGTPRPEGCYYSARGRLFLSTNSANAGRGAQKSREQLCELSTTSFARVANASCVSVGMEPVDDESTCARAALELGIADSVPSRVSAIERPQGCYYKGTLAGNSLFLAVNTLNLDNGGADGREAICKLQSAILPLNISDRTTRTATTTSHSNLRTGTTTTTTGFQDYYVLVNSTSETPDTTTTFDDVLSTTAPLTSLAGGLSGSYRGFLLAIVPAIAISMFELRTISA